MKEVGYPFQIKAWEMVCSSCDLETEDDVMPCAREGKVRTTANLCARG